MPQEGFKRKLTAILSADVKGYSRLMSQDEVGTIRTLNAHREAISGFVQQYKGWVVDSPGDNILTAFESVSHAVNCAVEIQRELAERNAEVPAARMMEWRIGVNLGEVVEENGRIYGDGVNLAARIENLAESGGICISGTVYDQVKNKLGLEYEYLGEQAVKNIQEPVRIYRILSHTAAAALEKTVSPAKKAEPSLFDQPSIAVLPFDNMSDDPDQEYFSDGMTEEIITRLSMQPMLSVIARNSTFTYKGKAVKVQQVGQELGVRYVVEGSVRKAGNRIRITAQLIDAATGSHLWAKTYDRELKDIFSLQDEIAHQIVTSMGPEGIGVAELSRVRRIPTENLTAYDSLLRGFDHHVRLTKEENTKAKEMFERAIGLDPEFAMAYVALGAAYLVDYDLPGNKNPRTLEQAFEFSRKAISLDDSLSLAHSLLAVVYRNKSQYEQAISQAERALSLNPSEANANLIMGSILSHVGRSEDAVEAIKRAMYLNPHYSANYSVDLSIAYRNLGQYEEAIASLKESLARNPDWIVTYYCLAMNYRMAWSTKQSQDPLILDRALEMAKKAVAIDDSYFDGHYELCIIYLYEQQHEKALAEAEKLIALAPENADDYAHLANIFNHIGRSGEAIEMVEKAMQLNPAFPAWYLTTLGVAYRFSGRQTEAVETLKRVFHSNPSHENVLNVHLSLAILYVALDQEEDARAEAEEILKLSPIFSVEVWGQRNPNKDQAQIERDKAALRKAGLN
jgi:adenylate cyclase